MKKGRKTPRRAEILAAKREQAQRTRAWLSERIAAAQLRKREKAAPVQRPDAGAPPEGVLRDQGAHGKTLEMTAVLYPDPEWLVQHTHPNNAMRRHDPRLGAQPPRNVVYVNFDRDKKPNRRLR